MRTGGFHPAHVQSRPQAPSGHFSGSWHFLTRISSSVLLRWLEAHPDWDERLSFSPFRLLLVLSTQAPHLVGTGG